MQESGKSEIKKLCLTGGWFSSYNIGDNAILLGIMDSFNPLADCSYRVITAKPEKVSTQYNIHAYAPKKTPFKLYKALVSSDALFFTGGTPFYDAKPHMTYYALLAMIAHFHKKPIIVFGISLREIKSSYSKRLIQYICRSASYLGGREYETVSKFKILSRNKNNNINILPDPAIRMRPISQYDAQNLLIKEGINPHARNIGICLRDFTANRNFQIHHYKPDFDSHIFTKYIKAVCDCIRNLITNHDCHIVFFPMHTVFPDDDRRVAYEAVSRISDKNITNKVTVLSKQYNPREMKGFLGLMMAVIGVRFHSLVLSSSMYTPVISIGYAKKNQAFMDYINQSDYSLNLKKLNSEQLKEKADDLIINLHNIETQLKERYSVINRKYDQQISNIIKIINQDQSSKVNFYG